MVNKSQYRTESNPAQVRAGGRGGLRQLLTFKKNIWSQIKPKEHNNIRLSEAQ